MKFKTYEDALLYCKENNINKDKIKQKTIRANTQGPWGTQYSKEDVYYIEGVIIKSDNSPGQNFGIGVFCFFMVFIGAIIILSLLFGELPA